MPIHLSAPLLYPKALFITGKIVYPFFLNDSDNCKHYHWISCDPFVTGPLKDAWFSSSEDMDLAFKFE